MSDRYKFDETPQSEDWQGGASPTDGMKRHPGPTIKVREPNGSVTERETRDALAELGARVLEIMREHERALARAGHPVTRPKSIAHAAIIDAARSLGLLESEAKP